MEPITRRQFLKNSTILAGAIALATLPININAATHLQGLCYGPFRDGQSPNLGVYPSVDEITEDISILSSITSTIKTYGIERSLYHIPRLCAEIGMECHAGGWISWSDKDNVKTINDLIQIGNEGNASSLIVGNEVLLWGYQTEKNLIEYVNKVQQATNLPVTSSDVWDVALAHPNLMENLDYLSIHVHPYWEGIPANEAAQYVIDRWNDVKKKYPDKEVILGETGWPTGGYKHIDAIPSEENQKIFLENMLSLTQDEPFLFFEAFNEKWKADDEGEVGAHWGILDSDGYPKLSAESLLTVIGHRTYISPPVINNADGESGGGGCFITSIIE